MATCYPCGHTVDEQTAPSFEYQDATFYFCSPPCEAQVRAEPENWLAMAKSPDAPTAHGHEHEHGHAH